MQCCKCRRHIIDAVVAISLPFISASNIHTDFLKARNSGLSRAPGGDGGFVGDGGVRAGGGLGSILVHAQR
jgi:hypothetical protein